MILKIRGAEIKTDPKTNSSQPQYEWWIYDNIAKVHHSRVPKHTQTSLECDVFIPKAENNVIEDTVRFVLRLKDGTELIIETDSIVFLLNDEGKTIDKIVA